MKPDGDTHRLQQTPRESGTGLVVVVLLGACAPREGDRA
jgi:hypothetical protein